MEHSMHLGSILKAVLAECGRGLSAARRYEALRHRHTDRGDIPRRIFEEFYACQGAQEHTLSRPERRRSFHARFGL